MTPSQNALIKAAILADPALANLPSDGDGLGAIATALNMPAVPDFVVWKSMLSAAESRAAIIKGASQLDNLTVGKRDSLLWIVSESVDCRDASVQTALNDLCGTQNTLKAAVLAAMKRKCSRIEQILATGTGSDAVPGITTFEGMITANEVDTARRS
jgi:hypothetical protein